LISAGPKTTFVSLPSDASRFFALLIQDMFVL
jgi:hypothetical protein